MYSYSRCCIQAYVVLCLAAVVAGCASPGGPAPDYAAIIAAPDRSDADRKNDQRRKPVDLFAFTGARPGMKALDMYAGGGYTTELLARAVGPGGTVYSHIPPDASDNARKAYAARSQVAAMKSVVRVERPADDPLPPGTAGLDLITFFFNYHDTVHLNVNRPQMNRRMFDALKPGGVLVLADHSARTGDGATVTQSLHRIEESVVRQELQAAGFQLVAEGNFLRNPQDTRENSVFKNTVPNDEFVLKFRKPQ
jgi:predicted methyltransferase